MVKAGGLAKLFTGIIEAVGVVLHVERGLLEVQPPAPADPYAAGESVAVNGCCLTVTPRSQIENDLKLSFDLSNETERRTALCELRVGAKVNLERALRADSRLGGHFVQGHVDATGSVADISSREGSHVMAFDVPHAYAKYLIDKGSIAVDGVSLTVVQPFGARFEAHLISTTWQMTALSERRIGDVVNLEFDVLARYVEKLTKSK